MIFNQNLTTMQYSEKEEEQPHWFECKNVFKKHENSAHIAHSRPPVSALQSEFMTSLNQGVAQPSWSQARSTGNPVSSASENRSPVSSMTCVSVNKIDRTR